MIAFYITLPIIVLISLGLATMAYVIFKHLFARKSRKHTTFENTFAEIRIKLYGKERLLEIYEWANSAISERLKIVSDDGLKLSAALIKAPADKPAKGCVLLFHGYHSAAIRDFSIQMKVLHDAGYHIIAPSQRSHDESEGKFVCFGIKERRDAILWSKKASEIFGEEMPLCLMGLSMGGATVLMASKLAKENPAIRCIVADCPFSSPFKIITEVLWRNHRIYPFPLIYFMNLWCVLVGKFNLFATNSKSSLKDSQLPALIIHGDGDKYVSISHSHTIVNDVPNAKLVIIEKAEHGNAIYHQKELYQKELLTFLKAHMK